MLVITSTTRDANMTKGILAAIGLVGMIFGAACSNTGAMKIGNDEYQISTRVPFSGPAGAKGKAIQTANMYCAQLGKEMMLKNVTSSECALHGGCGEAEIDFMCLAADDPRYQSPNLRKDNGGGTIENR